MDAGAALSAPKINNHANTSPSFLMTLLLLEALGALLLLLLIVWWTMFSGRERGELPQQPDKDAPPVHSPPTDKQT